MQSDENAQPGLLNVCQRELDNVKALRAQCADALTAGAAPEASREALQAAETALAARHGAFSRASNAVGLLAEVLGQSNDAPVASDPAVARARAELDADVAELAALVRQVADADAALGADVGACAGALAQADTLEGDDVAAMQSKVDAQAAELGEAGARRERAQTALAEKRAALAELQAEVAQLDARQQEAEADLAAARAVAESETAAGVTTERLGAMRAWFAEMTHALTQLSGVAIDEFAAAGDGVSVSLCGGSHRLTVAFKPGTTRVVAAQLLPAGDVSVDDLVAMGDLPLLVREARARLTALPQRRAALQRARDSRLRPLISDEDDGRLRVTFASGNSCVLLLPPAADAAPVVLELQACTGHSAAALAELRDSLNAAPTGDLVELLERVEARLSSS